MCRVLRTSGWNLTDSDTRADSGPVIVIVSGYFSPLHCGHLDYLEEAAAAGDRLVVIVNNNEQQILKKGKLIMDQEDRLRIVKALSVVDEAIISIDNDRSVGQTLASIAESNENSVLIFGNGGDRNSLENIPEGDVCHKYGIETIFFINMTHIFPFEILFPRTFSSKILNFFVQKFRRKKNSPGVKMSGRKICRKTRNF